VGIFKRKALEVNVDFSFVVGLGFELRALALLGKHS
jgi:hypothetical protein